MVMSYYNIQPTTALDDIIYPSYFSLMNSLTNCASQSTHIEIWGVLQSLKPDQINTYSGLIIGLRPANERRRCFVKTSLIGWAQT